MQKKKKTNTKNINPTRIYVYRCVVVWFRARLWVCIIWKGRVRRSVAFESWREMALKIEEREKHYLATAALEIRWLYIHYTVLRYKV